METEVGGDKKHRDDQEEMGNKKSFRLLPNPFASLPPVDSFPVVAMYSLKGAALLFSVGEKDEWEGKQN